MEKDASVFFCFLSNRLGSKKTEQTDAVRNSKVHPYRVQKGKEVNYIMTNLQKKVATAVATSAMLLNVLAPLAHANTNIEITGNGAYTNNDANVNMSNNTTVTQSNTAVVSNNVTSNATTGGNKANDNLTGNVIVKTGDATSVTNIVNDLNKNVADVENCDCEGDTNVKIGQNLAGSTNEIDLNSGHRSNSNETAIYQDNTANVTNDVDAKTSTGGNDANRNGSGDVTILTGDAKTKVSVATTANVNSATVGGGHGDAGSLSLMIVGNGAHTKNEIDAKLDRDVLVVQDNYAHVENDVDAAAKTGYNDANDNIGGDVAIVTGDAKTNVDVDNSVNFNMADVDCDCETDVIAKISGNLTDSKNEIKAKLGNDVDVYQGGQGAGNNAHLYNDVDGDAKTGDNDANRNGGDEYTDPAILTGDATSKTEVSNEGNVNVFGSAEMPSVHVPGVNVDVSLNFDLSDLLGWLGL